MAVLWQNLAGGAPSAVTAAPRCKSCKTVTPKYKSCETTSPSYPQVQELQGCPGATATRRLPPVIRELPPGARAVRQLPPGARAARRLPLGARAAGRLPPGATVLQLSKRVTPMASPKVAPTQEVQATSLLCLLFNK